MVPGIGGGELVVIAVVALIVVGPKDLPKLLRQLGRFVGKMRNMADEFRTSFEDMARQSELDELRKEVDALRAGKSVSPVIDDVSSQMRAIQSDINTNIVPSFTPSVTPEVAVASELAGDPQMVGLPPKADEVSEHEVVVKKSRPRKVVTIVDSAPLPDIAPADPVVKTPAKRALRKKAKT